MPYRIILADTQTTFRTGAARVLATESDFVVVAQCTGLASLREAIASFGNATVLFPADIAPDLTEVLGWVASAGSRSVLIAEPEGRIDALSAASVGGIVLRSVSRAELLECLHSVASGGHCLLPQTAIAPASPDHEGERIAKGLTPRELEVVGLVGEGAKNKEIALKLGITEQVVKNYLRTIYGKTGTADRLELALLTRHHVALATAAVAARSQAGRGQVRACGSS